MRLQASEHKHNILHGWFLQNPLTQRYIANTIKKRNLRQVKRYLRCVPDSGVGRDNDHKTKTSQRVAMTWSLILTILQDAFVTMAGSHATRHAADRDANFLWWITLQTVSKGLSSDVWNSFSIFVTLELMTYFCDMVFMVSAWTLLFAICVWQHLLLERPFTMCIW